MGSEVFQEFRAKIELHGTLPTRSNSPNSCDLYNKNGVYHPVQAWSTNYHGDPSWGTTAAFPGILHTQIHILNAVLVIWLTS